MPVRKAITPGCKMRPFHWVKVEELSVVIFDIYSWFFFFFFLFARLSKSNSRLLTFAFQVPNPALPKSFWWPLIKDGDKSLDITKLEEEFSAEESKELKPKKKEEVC